MAGRLLFSHIFSLLGLFALLAMITTDTYAGGGKIKEKDKEIAAARKKREAQLLSQLQSRFQGWDANKDNVLDKAELAKAFRGQGAKPYDDFKVPVVTPKTTTTSTTTPVKNSTRIYALALASLPRPGLPLSLAVAEVIVQPKVKETSTTIVPMQPVPPNFTTYGDFQFLQVVGKGGQQVARKDFDPWAKNYADLLERHEFEEREVKQAQQQLQKAGKDQKAKAVYQAKLQKHQQELAQSTKQLQTIPPLIQQALHPKK